MRFAESDGTDMACVTALIRSIVNGTPGSDDMPGALIFATTSDGAATTTERLRLVSGDVASFGNSSPPAWQTGGGYYNIQLGNAGYFRADTDSSGNFLSYGVNSYRDSSGWKFKQDGRATQINHGTGTDAITFYTSNSGNAGNSPTWTERLKVRADGKVDIGSQGTYGSGSTVVNIGSRANNVAGSLAIARGEGLGGGTGPYMEFVHGPDGGTQRIHSIYSYVGDFRIVADSNENMELHTGGSITAKFDTNGQFNLFGGTANYIESADFRLYSNTSIASGYTGNLRTVARYNTNSTLISHSETGGTGGGSRYTFNKACYVFISVSQDVIGNTDNSYWSQKLVRNGSVEGYHLVRKSNQWDNMAWSQGISVPANGWLEIQWNGTSGLTSADGTAWSHYNFLVWQH